MAEDSSVTVFKNVIIFGEAGSGKSSLINMLLDEKAAIVSDAAVGCTFDFKCFPYEVNNCNSYYNFYDTVGLSEGSRGLVDYKKAIYGLAKFLKSLKNGINLLIFVMRKDRIKKTLEENYKLFVETICMNNVPVILVVTRCEQDKVMGQWWVDNKKHFENYGMIFKDCICVCATKGEELLPDFAKLLESRYKQSRENLYSSIESHILPNGWKMKNWLEWFGLIMKKFWNNFCSIFSWPRIPYWPQLKQHFVEVGLDNETATQLANELYESAH